MLAATVRVARDIDVAEECVQDAYVAALDAWSRQGVPDNPAAWLTTTARRKALDAMRRDKTLQKFANYADLWGAKDTVRRRENRRRLARERLAHI